MRTPLLLLLTALPLWVSCQSDGPPDLTLEQKMGIYQENALRYWNLRDLNRTEHQCLKALELDPENERFLLMLGNVHLRRGRTEDILQALALFEQHPNQEDYRVHLGRGESHERLAVIEEHTARKILSGEHYTDALSPEEHAAELNTSAQEHLLVAKTSFAAAEDIHAGELNAVNGLIRTAALLGEDAESIEWSRKLIDILQTSSRVRQVELEDVSIQASREGQLLGAIHRNTQMIVKTRYHVSSLMRRQGRLQEAADELGVIVTLDPEASVAFSRRAQLFFELEQYLKAQESVERFITLEAARPFDDPEIRAAYDFLARCQAALEGDLAAGTGN